MLLGGADLSEVKKTSLTNCEVTIQNLPQLPTMHIRTFTYPSGIPRPVLETCHPICDACLQPEGLIYAFILRQISR